MRAFEICDDVKSANVDVPSSKDKPFANDTSKSLMSNESSYGGPILKFSKAWFKINSSVLPIPASDPLISYFFFDFFLTHSSIKQFPGAMSQAFI